MRAQLLIPNHRLPITTVFATPPQSNRVRPSPTKSNHPLPPGKEMVKENVKVFPFGFRRATRYSFHVNRLLLFLLAFAGVPCGIVAQSKPPVRFAIIGLTHDHTGGFIP